MKSFAKLNAMVTHFNFPFLNYHGSHYFSSHFLLATCLVLLQIAIDILCLFVNPEIWVWDFILSVVSTPCNIYYKHSGSLSLSFFCSFPPVLLNIIMLTLIILFFIFCFQYFLYWTCLKFRIIWSECSKAGHFFRSSPGDFETWLRLRTTAFNYTKDSLSQFFCF